MIVGVFVVDTLWVQEVFIRRVVGLLNLTAVQIVTMAVVFTLLLFSKEMVILTDQLSELLIHLTLGLILDGCIGVGDNSNEQIKHDYD